MDLTAQPNVLLVGELGFLLEGELQQQGFACASAETAGDAVNQLKAARFPVVVVPPRLQDMGGVEFIQGVLRFFDAAVVLYGDADQGEVEALVRTGRVAHLPQPGDGKPLVELLARAVPRVATPQAQAPKFNLTASPPSSGLEAALFQSTPPPARPPSFPPAPAASFGVAPSFAPPASTFPSGNTFPLPGGQPVVTGAPLPSASPFGAGALPSSGSFPPSQGFPASNSYPPSAGFAPVGSFPTTTPFGAPGALPTPASSFASGFPAPAASPRPPTLGPMPGADTATLLAEKQMAQQKLEVLADELARARAELQSVQARAGQAEQERATLLAEVEAARRSAIANVAEVMALSDEGDPISEELEDLRTRIGAAEKDRDAARADADALRGERDRLSADLAAASTSLSEVRARADAAEGKLAQTQTDTASESHALKELASGLSGEVEQTRDELEKAHQELEAKRAELEAVRKELEESRTGLVDKQAALDTEIAERNKHETRASELEHLLNEAHAAKAQVESELEQSRAASVAAREVEGALRIELDKTRADVASARTDATTSRLDLQEAMMRLDEAQSALDALQKADAALRAELEPLRTWTTQVVELHAKQQQDVERLRQEAANAAAGGAKLAELEAAVHKLTGDLEAARKAGGATVTGDVEVLLSRARHLASLVQALEPFMWGLTQATHFYTKAKVEGGDEHMRVLQQLQGVLLRLRDEIAMLDLG